MRAVVPACLAGLALLCAGMTAHAASVGLQDGVNGYSGTRDNSIYQNRTGNSNGGGDHIFSGVTQDSSQRRALVQFDLSAIPAGSTVTSASLRLSVNQSRPGTEPCTLHRLLADWGEGSVDAGEPGGLGAAAGTGDATWLARKSGTDLWTQPGGDFVTTPSATGSSAVAGTTTTLTGAGLVADIQQFIGAPATNFGWILIGNEAGIHNARRFTSREGTPGQRPELTVEFTPPARVEDFRLY